jgi:AAA15 family ATPase/GTPase
MKICRVKIKNFRNFINVDFALGQSAVIFGENQIGKTNLLFTFCKFSPHPLLTFRIYNFAGPCSKNKISSLPDKYEL